MSAQVIVQRYITESTNGKRQNADSPTGWERRSGTKAEGFEPEMAYRRRNGEKVLVATGLYKKVMQDVWEPCEGPRTVKYESRDAEGIKGGDIHAEITWPDLADVDLAEKFDRLEEPEWHVLVEALISKRAMAEFRRVDRPVDEAAAEARVQEMRDARAKIDSVLHGLGVDVGSIQRYDR